MTKGSLVKMGFEESKEGSNVFMREATDENGELVWECTLCCVGDVLAVSHRARGIIKDIAATHTLRDEMELILCLRTELGKQQLDDGTEARRTARPDLST